MYMYGSVHVGEHIVPDYSLCIDTLSIDAYKKEVLKEFPKLSITFEYGDENRYYFEGNEDGVPVFGTCIRRG